MNHCQLMIISLLIASLLSSLPPPQELTTCSTSGTICAKGDGKRLTVRAGNALLWSVPTSMMPIEMREDGLVVCVDRGLGILPAYDPNIVVLQAFKAGAPLRPMRLGELASRSQVQEGTSGWIWGRLANLIGNIAELELSNGTIVKVDLMTGAISRPAPAKQ